MLSIASFGLVCMISSKSMRSSEVVLGSSELTLGSSELNLGSSGISLGSSEISLGTSEVGSCKKTKNQMILIFGQMIPAKFQMIQDHLAADPDQTIKCLVTIAKNKCT